MDSKVNTRLKWIKMFESIGDAGLVCRRCGISRPTLRKWLQRYRLKGLDGLTDLSKSPQHFPKKKLILKNED